MDGDDDISEDSVSAWARLFRVSQAMLAAADAELKASGFPPLAWYDVLLELRRAGDNGLRPFELQQRMLLAQYNMSRLLNRVVTTGYAERLKCLDDGRGHRLVITGAGRTLLKDMWPSYRSIIREAFADRLDSGDIETLNAILQCLSRNDVLETGEKQKNAP